MSPPRKFDRYMVQAGAARHAKFRRLTVPERHAFFLGVLSIAAQAPIRGCLLVGNLAANAADVAGEADVTEKVAESAMEKLRTVGILFADEDLGCEVVHDFDQWNPAPKTDTTNAERQKRYRAKLKASRNGDVTRNETAPVTPASNGPLRGSASAEVEGEGEGKEASASSSAVAAEPERPDVTNLCQHLAGLIVANDPNAKPKHTSDGWRKAARLLLDADGRPFDEARSVIRWSQADPFWRANVLSMPKLREKYPQLLLKMNAKPAGRQGARPGWSTEEILASVEGNAA